MGPSDFSEYNSRRWFGRPKRQVEFVEVIGSPESAQKDRVGAERSSRATAGGLSHGRPFETRAGRGWKCDLGSSLPEALPRDRVVRMIDPSAHGCPSEVAVAVDRFLRGSRVVLALVERESSERL